MKIVIDGFNLIYKFPELEEMMYNGKINEARLGLLKILSDFSKTKKKDEYYIFFDGKKEQGSMVTEDFFGTMKIYFSHDTTADYHIKNFVKFAPNPNLLYVVSSDKDILGHCKKYKTKSYTSEEFSKLINEEFRTLEEKNTIEKPENVTESDINYWKTAFKERANEKPRSN